MYMYNSYISISTSMYVQLVYYIYNYTFSYFNMSELSVSPGGVHWSLSCRGACSLYRPLSLFQQETLVSCHPAVTQHLSYFFVLAYLNLIPSYLPLSFISSVCLSSLHSFLACSAGQLNTLAERLQQLPMDYIITEVNKHVHGQIWGVWLSPSCFYPSIPPFLLLASLPTCSHPPSLHITLHTHRYCLASSYSCPLLLTPLSTMGLCSLSSSNWNQEATQHWYPVVLVMRTQLHSNYTIILYAIPSRVHNE